MDRVWCALRIEPPHGVPEGRICFREPSVPLANAIHVAFGASPPHRRDVPILGTGPKRGYPPDDGVWSLHLGPVLLGKIDEATMKVYG